MKRSVNRRLHIVICGGKSAMLSHFRAPFIRNLITNGFEVTAIGGDYDPQVEKSLAELGAGYTSCGMRPTGLNPFADVFGWIRLLRLMRSLRPDIVMSYGLKPVVYGTTAAWAAGVERRVAMLEGLGYAFTRGAGLKRSVVRAIAALLLRVSLSRAGALVVMNEDDRQFFKDGRYKRDDEIHLVAGIGVDLAAFQPATQSPTPPYRVLMVSRLVEDKGVGDFVEAARLLKGRKDIKFVLVGAPDPNPTGYDLATALQWVEEVDLEYRGALDDVRPEVAAAYLVTLPSRREGFPVTIMEAAAMARAVIATDVPGCRDAVALNETGWLVPAENPASLAQCIELACSVPETVRAMGRAGRIKAERDFNNQRQAQLLSEITCGPFHKLSNN